MTKKQTKKPLVLPEITETLMSRCSSRVSSDGEPALIKETTDHTKTAKDKEELKLEYLKLPLLVWPKEEANIFSNPYNYDGCLSKTEPIVEPNAPETFQDELQALKENLKQLGTYQSPPTTNKGRKSSAIHKEELKSLKEYVKQVVVESRDIILEVRVRDEEAKKQTNEEKKAARKAAKFTDKTETSTSGLGKTNAMKNSVTSKRQAVKEHEEKSKMVQENDKDSDSESVLSVNSSLRDNASQSSSNGPLTSNSAENIANTTKRQKMNIPNNISRNDIENKVIKVVNGFVHEARRSINRRNSVVNLRPISEEGGQHTASCADKPIPQTGSEFKTNELDRENETLNDIVNDGEERDDSQKRHNKQEKQMKNDDIFNEKQETNETSCSNNVINNIEEQNINKHTQYKNFHGGNDEIKGITTEEVDFFQSQRIRRQNNGDLFDSRLNDLESISSKLTATSTRRSSSVGIPGNRVKDKKFYLERYRVPKQPMEIALQLHKLGFELESNRVRDLVAAIETCHSNLKKAIAQEKKDVIEERKRIERIAREKERQEAQRRRMEENEAKEARRKEKEAVERQKRRQAAIDRRKYNLELLRNINNTIIQSKASRSYRFSYFPYLPTPKRHSLAPSPDSSDCNSEEESESSGEVIPKIPVSYNPVTSRNSCHSTRTQQENNFL